MRLKTFAAMLCAPLAFWACGDDEQITQITQTGMEVVDSAADLPKCKDDNSGSMVWVSKDNQVQVCVEGRWKILESSSRDSVFVSDADTVFVSGVDTVVVSQKDTVVVKEKSEKVSCSTKPLADGTGIKIICDGDSVGVVMNSTSDTAGCTMESSTDSTITIKCGKGSYSINLVEKERIACSESSDDDEDCALEDVSLSGFSEKGPFVRGTSVSAFELQNGKNLLQTGKTFTGYINNDKGLFDIKSVKLTSQYAYLIADGFYRNEVTGRNSTAAIKLRALTNLKGRNSANINLMTHLEYERIFYLVTRKGVKVSDAKRQAENELFKAFHMDAAVLNLTGNSEDLTIFGESERNAALLAISIMLQGDRNESELTALLAAFSADFAEDGTWDDETVRDEVAAWVARAELTGKYARFRKNIAAWNLGAVPSFEKYMQKYWTEEYEVASCDGVNAKKGDTLVAKNGELYQCVDDISGKYEARLIKDYRDGKFYKTVTIDGRVWMAQNLNYDYPSVNGSYNICKDDDCDRYGQFYMWSVAMDSAGLYSDNSKGCGMYTTCTITYPPRGVCPEGWHVPVYDEMNNMFRYANYEFSVNSLQAKGYAKWTGATNELGFSAEPLGYHAYRDYESAGNAAVFHVAAEDDVEKSYHGIIGPDLTTFDFADKYYWRNVRCIMDYER